MPVIRLQSFIKLERFVGPARDIAPDSIWQFISGKENHSIDRASLIVVNKRHLFAVFKAKRSH